MYTIEGRSVVGILGSCMDNVLCPLKFRKCRLIGEEVIGKFQNHLK